MFFFSSRRRHTRFDCDWSSDVCSSDLAQAGIRIGGTPGDPEQDQNQRHEEYQRYHHAHEPELLSDHRKDEIGVLGGQECEALLWAMGEPLAQEAARTDGDLRLDDVPTGRAAVHLW